MVDTGIVDVVTGSGLVVKDAAMGENDRMVRGGRDKDDTSHPGFGQAGSVSIVTRRSALYI